MSLLGPDGKPLTPAADASAAKAANDGPSRCDEFADLAILFLRDNPPPPDPFLLIAEERLDGLNQVVCHSWGSLLETLSKTLNDSRTKGWGSLTGKTVFDRLMPVLYEAKRVLKPKDVVLVILAVEAVQVRTLVHKDDGSFGLN